MTLFRGLSCHFGEVDRRSSESIESDSVSLTADVFLAAITRLVSWTVFRETGRRVELGLERGFESSEDPLALIAAGVFIVWFMIKTFWKNSAEARRLVGEVVSEVKFKRHNGTRPD